MSAPARAGNDVAAGSLTVGSILEGRFRIQELIRTEAGSELYQAVDGQGGATVMVRLVTIVSAAGRAALEVDLVRATRVSHKNLTSIVAVGDHGGQVFVAFEREDGHTLRELVDARRGQGQTVGLDYAQTLMGHVVHALEEVHKAMAHGGLTPECIWVTRSGRVKVSQLGFGRGLPALGFRGGPAGAPEGIYVAPEVMQGSGAAPASDVYSLGAMLYELLTGMAPVPPMQPPSKVIPAVAVAVDAVVGKALSPHPQERFASPVEMLHALIAATSAPAPSAEPREIIRGSRSFDVTHAAGMAENDERWLVQKDRLDYGPFSLTQIMAQLERGAFHAEHHIVDVDSGERQKIKEHPLLGEFAVEAERRLESVRRQQADRVSETVERKKSRATFVIVGVAVIVVGGGLALYLNNRKAAEDDVLVTRSGEEDVDAFIKQFKLDVPSAKGKVRARRGGGRSDDFSGVTNLGDVSSSGGDEILSDAKIQAVMMGNYRKLVPCIMEERRRNAGLSDIDIEFVVLGSGKVSAVRVNGQQKGGFPGCVLGRMQSFGFPSYNGKKTIASWSMSLR